VALEELKLLALLGLLLRLDTVAVVAAAAQHAARLWLATAATHRATRLARPSSALAQAAVARLAPSAELAARWLARLATAAMLALQLALAVEVVVQSSALTQALEIHTQS